MLPRGPDWSLMHHSETVQTKGDARGVTELWAPEEVCSEDLAGVLAKSVAESGGEGVGCR